jgi:Conjugative transposon protein TcpC
VANTPRTIAKTSLLRVRFAPRATLSDATLTRAAAALLWVLIVVAAAGGVYAWARSPSGSTEEASTADTTGMSNSVWAATGFAERYVTAYLLAGADGRSLAPFLGYSPEMPTTQQPSAVVAPARVVGVEGTGDQYWAVTVAIGPPGQERYWQAAVDTTGSQPVAVGLPAAVPGPPAEVDRTELAVNLVQPPADDPVAETVTGFLGAYLCGQGELSRYLRPGLMLTAADPAVCSQVELVRWGSSGDGDEDEARVVVAEVQLISGTGDAAVAQQSMYAARMAQRDGRWEVAELLPAPPRQQDAAE